ncbi:MAG TPA: ISAs1 family transposase [Pseudonocardia sp.]|nr:ISAs1 family transposase [Pseudonocardia sp.]
MPALQVSPIVAALDQPEAGLDRETVPRVALSLVEAFAEIPDPRHARGIRHGVLAILLLGACAVLTGARSFAAIAEYAHDTGRAILDLLGVGAVVPHASTIRRVLQDLDPDAVEAAMRRWALAQLADRPAPDGVPGREQRRVLALDGKTVRGAHIPTSTDTDAGPGGGGGYRQPHLVSVLDQGSGVVLGQVEVEAKGSEVAAFTTLLDELDLTDVLVTADAVHTNRNHADYLHERGGHYLLSAKLNQPTLLRRLRALPWTQIGVAGRERGRGHGRVETRTVSVVSLHPCPDAGGEFFPHAAQAIKLVRRRRALGSRKWTTVTVYAITSLTAAQADPVLLARWLRGHWAIEALHWVRDVSFDEDRSQVRTSSGPQIMAALRNLVITALRLAGVTNIAAALRHHARDPHRPLSTYKIA